MKQLSFGKICSTLFRECPLAWLVLFVTTIIGGAAAPAEIWFRQRLIDSVAIQQLQVLIIPLLGMISCACYTSFYSSLSFAVGNRMTRAIKGKLLGAINGKVTSLEYKSFEHGETLDLLQRVRSHPNMGNPEDIFYRSFTKLLSLAAIALNAILMFFMVAQAKLWIGVLVLCLAILSCVITMYASRMVYETRRETSEAQRMSGYYEEQLKNRENAHERILFSSQSLLYEKWSHYLHEFLNRTIKASIVFRVKGMGMQVANVVVILVVLLLFLNPLMDQTISIGFYISMVIGVTTFSNTLNVTLPDTMNELTTAKQWIKDYNELFLLASIDESLELPSSSAFVHKVEFEQVSFRYPDTEQLILQDVSFTMEKGKHYAIVGANGCGKSTLIKLLTGLYAPTAGRILINDRDISTYSNGELSGMMSVAFQDFSRYFTTLRDNVAVGRIDKKLTDSEMEEALAQLGMSLENLSLDTVLGKIREDGIDLSGGQWQMISLARVLCANRGLVILDEPTAALDPMNESLLYQKFGTILNDNLSIMISHRLGSTKFADEILVMDGGHIREQGAHEYLMEADGMYREMFESQARWYQ